MHGFVVASVMEPRLLPIRRVDKDVSSGDKSDKETTKQASVKRPRRSAPKVKTGCTTCK